jgi:hypothetical protein
MEERGGGACFIVLVKQKRKKSEENRKFPSPLLEFDGHATVVLAEQLFEFCLDASESGGELNQGIQRVFFDLVCAIPWLE